MILYDLSLYGYKNFVKAKLKNAERIASIVGCNGSGKSSFVSFLDFLSCLLNNKLEDFLSLEGIQVEDLFNRWHTNNPIAFVITFKDDNNLKEDIYYKYSCSIHYCNEKQVSFGAESLEDSSSNDPIFLCEEVGKKTPFLQKQMEEGCEISKQIYDFILHMKRYTFSSINKQLISKPSDTNNGSILNSDYSNLSSVLFHIKNKNPDLYRELNILLENYISGFEGFIFHEENSQVQALLDKEVIHKPLPLHFLSDGNLRILILYLILNTSKEEVSLLILEEADVCLHFTFSSILYELINTFIEEGQLILTINSLSLLKNIGAKNVYMVFLEEDVINGGSNSTIQKISYDKISVLLNEYSIDQIYQMNMLQSFSEEEDKT